MFEPAEALADPGRVRLVLGRGRAEGLEGLKRV